MMQFKDISKLRLKEELLLSIKCSIKLKQEKKPIILQFFNSYLKVVDETSLNSLGIIPISDYIRIEWIIREGSETQNAFDRCEGFHIDKDDIYALSKAAQEKESASQLDPLVSQNSKGDYDWKQKSRTISEHSDKLKNSHQNLDGKGESAFKQNLAEIELFDVSQLKKAYNYFAPRVIMKQFHDHYKAIKKLGKGSFASVYLVSHRETGKQLAIKAFLKDKLYLEDKGPEAFFNEINIMKQINHYHLLKLYEVWESTHSFYYVIELANGGSFMDRIQQAKRSKRKGASDKDKDGAFSEIEIKQYLKQMLEGIQHLKEKRILHRDIKPDNILLRKIALPQQKIQNNNIKSEGNQQQQQPYKYEVILVDFGLGSSLDVREFLFPKCGTPGYVAPEIINLKGDLSKAKYSTQCDVFSVGAVFYFMLTLKPLFLGSSTKETIDLNKKCLIDYNIPELKDYDKETIDLLQKMLEKEPSCRIDPKSALKHPFFKCLDQFCFDEDFVVPEDTPTQISKTLKQFSQETFDMSKINSLINSQMRSSLGSSNQASNKQEEHSSILVLSFLNKEPISPDMTNKNQQSPLLQSELLGRSPKQNNSSFQESLSLTDKHFVNKNQNVYGDVTKLMISQHSFETDKNGSDSVISRQESQLSNQSHYSLKMKAHYLHVPSGSSNKDSSPKTKQKQYRFRTNTIEEKLQGSNNNNNNNNTFSNQNNQNSINLTLSTVIANNNNIEGRTKSPSRFRVDFEKSRASYDQFEQAVQSNRTEESAKEQDITGSPSRSPKLLVSNRLGVKQKDQVIGSSKFCQKQGTLEEQFYSEI